ncbi:MAG: hypothetical protein JNL06_10620 [Alphaproteobacteria bacterium]|nr:hypothetical protein [Alphaproteobacteria bacterium]
MPPESRRIILEMTTVGSSQKVTAIDEQTGVEVSFVAPASAPRADLERLARSKLNYVLHKKNGDA